MHSVLHITSPRADNGCRETWLLVRTDYYIKMLKFTSLSSMLGSIIYPINLRLKMLYVTTVSQKPYLNGFLSRIKTCYRLECNNITFSATSSFNIQFKTVNLQFKNKNPLYFMLPYNVKYYFSTQKWSVMYS